MFFEYVEYLIPDFLYKGVVVSKKIISLDDDGNSSALVSSLDCSGDIVLLCCIQYYLSSCKHRRDLVHTCWTLHDSSVCEAVESYWSYFSYCSNRIDFICCSNEAVDSRDCRVDEALDDADDSIKN